MTSKERAWERFVAHAFMNGMLTSERYAVARKAFDHGWDSYGRQNWLPRKEMRADFIAINYGANPERLQNARELDGDRALPLVAYGGHE